MRTTIPTSVGSAETPWNKGRLIGQKRPLKPKEVWAIRVRLQLWGRKRDLALFNLAIDSKLRGCDLVVLQVDDVCAGGRVPRDTNERSYCLNGECYPRSACCLIENAPVASCSRHGDTNPLLS